MITRYHNFFEFFNIEEPKNLQSIIQRTVRRQKRYLPIARDLQKNSPYKQKDSTLTNFDYYCLSAILLYKKPKRVFEIGTYLGLTSDFILELLPDCNVISTNIISPPTDEFYLPKKYIGCTIHKRNRDRYTQIYEDSKKINIDGFINQYGKQDLIFIDGEHSFESVDSDTKLSKKIKSNNGVIVWHDVSWDYTHIHCHPRYFLYINPEIMVLASIILGEDSSGGIACWNEDIEKDIYKLHDF